MRITTISRFFNEAFLNEQANDMFLERGTFMHVWEKVEQGWRIKRVISYDHKGE